MQANEAALRIQECWRDACARAGQSELRRFTAEVFRDNLLRWEAVEIIQNCVRAWCARRRLRRPREADPALDRVAEQQERSYACRIIQRARYQLILREELLAAVVAEKSLGVMEAVEQEAAYAEAHAVIMQSAARKMLARMEASRRRHTVRERQSALRHLEAQQVVARTWRRCAARRHVQRLEEAQRNREAHALRLEAALALQATYRGWKGRQAGRAWMAAELHRRQCRAATRLQCAWRQAAARAEFRRRAQQHLVTTTVDRLHHAASLIQAVARGRATRRALRPDLRRNGPKLAVPLARCGRAYRARRELADFRRRLRAAVAIQRWARRCCARTALQDRRRVAQADRRRAAMKTAATIIQRNARKWAAQRSVEARRLPPQFALAVVRIQTFIRGRFARLELQALRYEATHEAAMVEVDRAVTILQTRVRGFLARLRFGMIMQRRQRAKALLAACARGLAVRAELSRLRFFRRQCNAAVAIQTAFSSFVTRRRARTALEVRRRNAQIFQERMRAAVIIAACWRSHTARTKHQALLIARRRQVTLVQSCLRQQGSQLAVRERVVLQHRNAVARRIQAAWGQRKVAVREKREARELELALIRMDLTALGKREALERHFVTSAEAQGFGTMMREQSGIGEAIAKRIADREASWLARTPAGTQMQAAKGIQASTRSFATRRRELLRLASADAEADGAEGVEVDPRWFPWLRELQLEPRSAVEIERLLRRVTATRNQVEFEEGAMRQQQQELLTAAIAQLRFRAESKQLVPTEDGADAAATSNERQNGINGGPSAGAVVLDLSHDGAVMTEQRLRSALRDAYHRLDIASVTLDGCGISDAGCSEVALFIHANPHVAHVSLRGNRITDVGASHLVAAVSQLGRLVQIDIRGNFAQERYVALLERVAAPGAATRGALRPLARARARATLRDDAHAAKVTRVAAPIAANSVPLVGEDTEE
jgi:hypothetical protein